MVAASSVLSASLKFEGSLVLQLQGDGPIKLIVAECNNKQGLRATVKMRSEHEDVDGLTFQELANQTGKGLCVLILDPQNRKPGQQTYQGIVPLTGTGVSESLESYMQNSEQLNTRLILHADDQSAAGIMLQEMPKDGGIEISEIDPNGWETLQALGATATEEELLQLDLKTSLYRLFSDMNPEILATRRPHFSCSCSRNKVERMLISLGQNEVQETLKEQNVISVQCDFCNAEYAFGKTDCDALFNNDDEDGSTGAPSTQSPTLH